MAPVTELIKYKSTNTNTNVENNDEGIFNDSPHGDILTKESDETTQQIATAWIDSEATLINNFRLFQDSTDMKNRDDSRWKFEFCEELPEILTANFPAFINTSLRNEEREWILSQVNMLKLYQGKWVAIEGKELIAYGDSISSVASQAKSKGINIPYILKLPLDSEIPFIG